MGNNQSSSSSHSHSRENSSSHSSGGMKPSISSTSLRSRSSTLSSDSRTMISGGFLEPQSLLYSHVEYHRPTVHKLIIDHKLSPFYLGLNDFEPTWSVEQLVEALVEAEQQATTNLKDALIAQSEQVTECEANQLNAPQGTRKQKEAVQALSLAMMRQERLRELIKIRDKRGGGGLQWTSKGDQAKLYQTCALECPICFLYYPPNMVHTRCCDQPICTECFVQIKRAEPTPTHLESEPAACPFCMEPNFGCIYEKPTPTRPMIQEHGSSGSSSDQVVGAAATPPKSPKPRRKSFAHTEKEVVTTDMLHPDWESKLEAMKATVARRANRRIVFRQVGDRLIPVGITSGRAGDGANATMATQTLPPDFLSQIAAALDHSNESGGGGGGSSSGGRSGFRVRSSRRRGGSTSGNGAGENDEVTRLLESLGLGGGPDLEEMMLQEAMRLSQLEEEERQKKVREEEEKKQREQREGLGGASASGGSESMNRKSTETTERELSEAMGHDLSRGTTQHPPTTTFPAAASTSQFPPPPTINTTLPPLSHNDPNSTSTPTSSTTPTATTFPSSSSSSSALPPIESSSFLGDVLAPSTSRASESSASFVQNSPMAGYQQLEDDDSSIRTTSRPQGSQDHEEQPVDSTSGSGGGKSGNLIDF